MNKFEKKYLKYKSKYVSSKINLKGGGDFSIDNTNKSLLLSKDFKKRCDNLFNKMFTTYFEHEDSLLKQIKELQLTDDEEEQLKELFLNYDETNEKKKTQINDLIQAKINLIKSNYEKKTLKEKKSTDLFESYINSTNSENYHFNNKRRFQDSLTEQEIYEYNECIKYIIFKFLEKKYKT